MQVMVSNNGSALSKTLIVYSAAGGGCGSAGDDDGAVPMCAPISK